MLIKVGDWTHSGWKAKKEVIPNPEKKEEKKNRWKFLS